MTALLAAIPLSSFKRILPILDGLAIGITGGALIVAAHAFGMV